MIDERNIVRDERILAAAADLAISQGLSGITRGLLALHAGISRTGVSNYGRSRITNGPQGTAGVLDRIKAGMMHRAVDRGDLAVLKAGIAACHPVAVAAPAELRVAALAEG